MQQTLNISLFMLNFAMMAMVGTRLSLRHFADLVHSRRVVPGALLAQTILLPVIGWCVVRLLGLPPQTSAAILLIAACPVGDIANFYTVLGRANAALSVTLNALSCLLAVLTMPLAFELYARLAGEPFTLAAPTPQLILRVILLTAIPIVAGMLLRRYAPIVIARCGAWIETGCLVGVAGVVALIILAQGEVLAAQWKPAVSASLLLMTLALAGAWACSRLLHLSAEDRATLSIVFPVRNIVLATTLAVTVLGRVDYAAFAVLYFLVEVPLLLLVIAVSRWRPVGVPCASAVGGAS